MRPADTWKDYELLDATDGNRLERWGETLLVRPDPHTARPLRHPARLRTPWPEGPGECLPGGQRQIGRAHV